MSMRVAATTDLRVLDRAYTDILEPSFPATELVERSVFLDQVRRGDLDAMIAHDEGAVSGIIVGERVGSTVLIAWLAVRAAQRDRGAGSALLIAGTDRWLGEPGVELVLAEIERPDSHLSDEAFGDPRRRIDFYARHGGGALALPYYQPPIAEGMPRVRGLILSVVASATGGRAPRALSAAETDAVQSYLSATFGPPEPGDDETARIHAAAAAQEGLHLIALTDYRELPV